MCWFQECGLSYCPLHSSTCIFFVMNFTDIHFLFLFLIISYRSLPNYKCYIFFWITCIYALQCVCSLISVRMYVDHIEIYKRSYNLEWREYILMFAQQEIFFNILFIPIVWLYFTLLFFFLQNMLIMMELVLIVYINTKVVRDMRGWQGAACVVFMLPLCIMILLLTRLLTKMYMKKYALANFNYSK